MPSDRVSLQAAGEDSGRRDENQGGAEWLLAIEADSEVAILPSAFSAALRTLALPDASMSKRRVLVRPLPLPVFSASLPCLPPFSCTANTACCASSDPSSDRGPASRRASRASHGPSSRSSRH